MVFDSLSTPGFQAPSSSVSSPKDSSISAQQISLCGVFFLFAGEAHSLTFPELWQWAKHWGILSTVCSFSLPVFSEPLRGTRHIVPGITQRARQEVHSLAGERDGKAAGRENVLEWKVGAKSDRGWGAGQGGPP